MLAFWSPRGWQSAAWSRRWLPRFMPAWMAQDLRQMAERFVSDGMRPGAGDVERLVQLLGRLLRTYGAFAAEHAPAG